MKADDNEGLVQGCLYETPEDALESWDELEPGETPLVAFLGRPVGLKWRLKDEIVLKC